MLEAIQQKSFYQIIEEKRKGEDGILYHCAGIEMRYNDIETNEEICFFVQDISTNIHSVRELVKTMNHCQLDPIHFWDVIEDFCQNENRIL